MAATNETQMTVIDGKYYQIQDKPTLYDIRFPLAIAIDIHNQPKKPYYNYGPGWCWECRDNCTLNGVFIGFCNYCAIERLHGKYGSGSKTPISELSSEDLWQIYPYMEGTPIQDIGITPAAEDEKEEKKQSEELSENALLISMGRSVLNNNVGPMGEQMSWAEYREYLDNKWWDEC